MTYGKSKSHKKNISKQLIGYNYKKAREAGVKNFLQYRIEEIEASAYVFVLQHHR